MLISRGTGRGAADFPRGGNLFPFSQNEEIKSGPSRRKKLSLKVRKE
jgi:hypothetical protein